MTDEEKEKPDGEENSATVQADTVRDEGEKNIAQVVPPRRRKRNGKYVSKLDAKELENLQKRKSLYMYLSTLFFAVTLFLKVEGRTRLSENSRLFAVFTLYVLAEVVLIVLTVYVSVQNRTGQKIGREIKEKNTPRGGLDTRTFTSYECFNALHIALALGEIAVSLYDFGVWGALNIVSASASAVFAFLSRQVLFRANAGNLEYFPAREHGGGAQ